MFSIKIELEFFAAARVKRKDRKKQNRRAGVNNINHRFRFKIMNVQGIPSIPIHRSRRLIADSQFHSLQQIRRKQSARLIKKCSHYVNKSLRCPHVEVFIDARRVLPNETKYYGIARLGMRVAF